MADDSLDKLIENLEQRLAHIAANDGKLNAIFTPDDIRSVLIELLALKRIRTVAFAAGGKEEYEKVHKAAREEARHRAHEARHGRDYKQQYEQKPNVEDPPDDFYDAYRDRYWNASTKSWESGIHRAKRKWDSGERYSTYGSYSDSSFNFDRQKFEEEMRKFRERYANGSGYYYSGFNQAPPPPPGSKRSAYEILGVRETATIQEIKKAYQRLAMKHHTDRGGSHEKMAEINMAWAKVKAMRGVA